MSVSFVRWAAFASLTTAAVTVSAVACSSFGEDESPDGSETSTDPDAPAEASVADGATLDSATGVDSSKVDGGGPCDPMAPFNPSSMPVPGIPAGDTYSARLTKDETGISFSRYEEGYYKLKIALRSDRSVPFSAEQPLAAASHPQRSVAGATVSSDQLQLVYYTTEADGGDGTIFHSTRLGVATSFSPGISYAALANIDAVTRRDPFFAVNGDLYFASREAAAPHALYVLPNVPGATNGPVPVNTGVVSGNAEERAPVLSFDELTMYFQSSRTAPTSTSGATGNGDVWVMRRNTRADAFGLPVFVPELSSALSDEPSWLSPDNCRLYLSRVTSPGVSELIIFTRPPKQ